MFIEALIHYIYAGKVFVYWLGTEPFLYIADPEFIKKMSAGVMGKSWGKPTVFKRDRKAMFGNGLVMVEGDEWVRHRHLITPAFTQANVKVYIYIYIFLQAHSYTIRNQFSYLAPHKVK